MQNGNPLLSEAEQKYRSAKRMLDYISLAQQIACQVVSPIDRVNNIDSYLNHVLNFCNNYVVNLEKEVLASPPKSLLRQTP